jgi:hypothetical protein
MAVAQTVRGLWSARVSWERYHLSKMADFRGFQSIISNLAANSSIGYGTVINPTVDPLQYKADSESHHSKPSVDIKECLLYRKGVT